MAPGQSGGQDRRSGQGNLPELRMDRPGWPVHKAGISAFTPFSIRPGLIVVAQVQQTVQAQVKTQHVPVDFPRKQLELLQLCRRGIAQAREPFQRHPKGFPAGKAGGQMGGVEPEADKMQVGSGRVSRAVFHGQHSQGREKAHASLHKPAPATIGRMVEPDPARYRQTHKGRSTGAAALVLPGETLPVSVRVPSPPR